MHAAVYLRGLPAAEEGSLMARYERGVARLSLGTEDTGCEVAPKCLECPLPRCKYDEPPRPARAREPRTATEQRHAEIDRLRAEGMTVREAAAAAGVAIRTVYRARAARQS